MEIRRIGPSAGVEALGVDLSKPVSDAARSTLNQAFIEHSVLVIRGQTLTAPRCWCG